ncbi:MAG: BtrH N-terminal domain-containing protein [Candidatus Hodarchaeota archaeon]
MRSRHVIKTLKHTAGSHCESTTMKDLIIHEGIAITEEMVFGLDSTFGFTFFDNSQSQNAVTDFSLGTPLFIGCKQGSITDKSMACRILGLNISFETFSSPDVAWDSSKKWINQDILVGLQVDMGYLSYFDWKEKLHFGGHFITLAGYDEAKNLAFVYDTEFSDVQEISIGDLKNARSSKHGPRFLHPHNTQVTIVKRLDGKKPPFPKAVKLALQQVAQQVISPSTNRHGIPALRLFAKSISRWRDILKGDMKHPYTSKIVPKAFSTLEMMYGLIEEWGTGGSIFRNLYSNFLKELLNHSDINDGSYAWKEEELFYLEDAHEQITKSAILWSKFSNQIKKALETDKENCLDYIDFNESKAIIENIISLEETCFRNLLKIKL